MSEGRPNQTVHADGKAHILRSSSKQTEPRQSLETQVIVAQRDHFSNEQQIFSDAKRHIIRAIASTELIYLGVPPAWGALIADSLAEELETTASGGARQDCPAYF